MIYVIYHIGSVVVVHTQKDVRGWWYRRTTTEEEIQRARRRGWDLQERQYA